MTIKRAFNIIAISFLVFSHNAIGSFSIHINPGNPNDSTSYSLEFPDGTEYKNITGLILNNTSAKMEIEHALPLNKISITIKGEYKRNNWQLINDNKPLATGTESGTDFSITVPIENPETDIEFAAAGPNGALETDTITVVIKDLEKFQKAVPLKRFSFSPSLGISLINYKETNIADFSEKAFVLKMYSQYMIISQRLDAELTAGMTFLSIMKSQPDRSIGFTDINGHLGYTLFFIPAPWKITIRGGYHYKNISGSTDIFSLRTLTAMEFFPVVTYKLNNSNSLFGYFKIIPYNSGSSSRELNGGLGWVRPLQNGHPLSLVFDYYSIQLNTSAKTMDMGALTLSCGYGL